MLKHMMLIVNPAAGKGTKKAQIFDVIRTFNKAGYAVTVHITEKRGDAEKFAQQYGADYEMVVCCGGDGTLDETINGILKMEGEQPKLGYIPVGTANDVATTLGLPRTPVKAAELLMRGKVLNMDIGSCRERFFSYIAAFGAFTGASYETPQNLKNKFGQLAYIVSGAKYLTQISSISLAAKWDDNEISGEFIFGSVSNSTSVAGMLKLKPEDVQLDDGMFEVILVRKPANVMQLERIVNGILTKKYDPQYVEFFHTSKIKFSFTEEVAWTFDGEDGGKHREIVLGIRPSAIKMLIPNRESNVICL